MVAVDEKSTLDVATPLWFLADEDCPNTTGSPPEPWSRNKVIWKCFKYYVYTPPLLLVV